MSRVRPIFGTHGQSMFSTRHNKRFYIFYHLFKILCTDINSVPIYLTMVWLKRPRIAAAHKKPNEFLHVEWATKNNAMKNWLRHRIIFFLLLGGPLVVHNAIIGMTTGRLSLYECIWMKFEAIPNHLISFSFIARIRLWFFTVVFRRFFSLHLGFAIFVLSADFFLIKLQRAVVRTPAH